MGAAPAPDASDLAAQIRELADRAALSDLCNRYLLMHDEGRFTESQAQSFLTEDVELSFPPGNHRGIAGLDAFTETFMGPWARTHHHASNYVIELAGDRATVTWSVIATHVHRSSPPPPASGDHFHLGGRFQGTAVRTPHGWRMQRLALRVLWTIGTGAPAVMAIIAGDDRRSER
ncbi:nuclear transport factor 2 family protein [Geodermatophilus sp. SYSU D01176]